MHYHVIYHKVLAVSATAGAAEEGTLKRGASDSLRQDVYDALLKRLLEGRFAPGEFLNRLGGTGRRGRARWVPDQALRSDLRVFLLLAAPSEGALPAATITQDPCAADSCFQVSIGADTWELSFSGQDGVYDLLSVVQQ